MWKKLVAAFAAIVAVIVALVLSLVGGGGTPKHQATCWQPSYAAAPTASWARDPSPLHRHGAGPRGSNVCG